MHPDDHARQTSDTPGFKAFTKPIIIHAHTNAVWTLISYLQWQLKYPNKLLPGNK